MASKTMEEKRERPDNLTQITVINRAVKDTLIVTIPKNVRFVLPPEETFRDPPPESNNKCHFGSLWYDLLGD